ncbi:MAG TPA: UDP-N-acetylglucosamine 1-carboxyvinyltransferase, partial [Candidatus Acetothermia bacterium]|nr:UDP-N-acetylglucosamine 1-carboxyvinyltransferase [Candidatus Acetothermia bacterium]
MGGTCESPAAASVILIRGGRPLSGEVLISGAKNAALPAIFASLLTPEPVWLGNVPHLTDVETALELIRALGKRVRWEEHWLVIEQDAPPSDTPPRELVQRMRASFLCLGPILARKGRARVPLPGGCPIGARPVDLHLKGLAALGAKIEMHGGQVVAEAQELRGEEVRLNYPSVGATEQLLLAGALAQGETTVLNPAREPEVEDLGRLLSAIGAEVSWRRDRVVIRGREELSGARHRVIPDRIEAGTYLLAAAAVGGKVRVRGVVPQHLQALLVKLHEAALEVNQGQDWVQVVAEGRPQALKVETGPYPGFPTDLQPPLVSALTLAEGESVVRETVFENRFGHVEGLVRMGADIRRQGQGLVVRGVEKLVGARVIAPDLRAG